MYCYWTNYLHGQPLERSDSLNGEECIPSNGAERRGIRDEKTLSDLGCSWHRHSTSVYVHVWCWSLQLNPPEQIPNIKALTKLTVGLLPSSFPLPRHWNGIFKYSELKLKECICTNSSLNANIKMLSFVVDNWVILPSVTTQFTEEFLNHLKTAFSSLVDLAITEA